jgi:hypothetical protein
MVELAGKKTWAKAKPCSSRKNVLMMGALAQAGYGKEHVEEVGHHQSPSRQEQRA